MWTDVQLADIKKFGGEVIVGKEVYGDTHTDRLVEWFGLCGCGEPETALLLARDILGLFERTTQKGDLDAWRRANEEVDRRLCHDTEPGLYYSYLNWLDGLGVIEHGGGIGGSWLTPEGERILAVLRAWEPEC